MGLEERLDLDSIREFVMVQLSEQNGLLPNAFPMTQKVLERQGSTCGVFYCLHGPRSIRLTAILDTNTARILTYDSRGERSGAFEVCDAVGNDSDSLFVKSHVALGRQTTISN
jgi:hypothetical protein